MKTKTKVIIAVTTIFSFIGAIGVLSALNMAKPNVRNVNYHNRDE